MLARSERQQKNTYAEAYFSTTQLCTALGLDSEKLHSVARSGVALACQPGHARGVRRDWPLVDACSLAAVAALWRLTEKMRWSGQTINELLCLGEVLGGQVGASEMGLSHRDAAQLVVERAAERGELPALYRPSADGPTYITAVLPNPQASAPVLHLGGLDLKALGHVAGVISINLTRCLDDLMERLNAEG